MIATTDPVALLLAELIRRGIVVVAVGDKLRYRPRSAMTPDLADRLWPTRPTWTHWTEPTCSKRLNAKSWKQP